MTFKKVFNNNLITTNNLMRFLLLTYGVFVFWSCKSTETVPNSKPIDSTSRPITYQIKKTYAIEDLGVYASNEFDAARLNGFEKMSDSSAAVIINAENTPINKSPYYAFNIWSKTEKPFYLTFKYPKGYKHRYIPKIKNNNDWSIIDPANVFKNDSIVTIKLNLSTKPQTVSAQEVQSSTDVYNWYTKLIEGKSDVVNLKKFGKSVLGRDLVVLNLSKGETKGKDVVVLMTRQHPPEITGYFAYQTFLETILNDSNLSSEFLEKYHVLAFPLMNPDGVDLGNWRHNSNGVDTNIDWINFNQPEIIQIAKYINKVLKKNDAKMVLGLDFHSIMSKKDIFYTNKTKENTALPDFIDDWFTALEANISNYKVRQSSPPIDTKLYVSKGWMLYKHNAVGITVEIADVTPKDRIKTFGKISAEQMMRLLNQ